MFSRKIWQWFIFKTPLFKCFTHVSFMLSKLFLFKPLFLPTVIFMSGYTKSCYFPFNAVEREQCGYSTFWFDLKRAEKWLVLNLLHTIVRWCFNLCEIKHSFVFSSLWLFLLNIQPDTFRLIENGSVWYLFSLENYHVFFVQVVFGLYGDPGA